MPTFFHLGLDAGGARVDHLFKQYIAKLLQSHSEMDSDEITKYVSDGLRDFQSRAKRQFANAETPFRVQLGQRRMNSTSLQITKGVMSFKGCEAKCLCLDTLLTSMARTVT